MRQKKLMVNLITTSEKVQCASVHIWFQMTGWHPKLAPEGMQILLPFPATYLCKSSFSTLTVKYRAHL